MRALAPQESCRVESRHGLGLEVHCWSQRGEPLLLLHGFGLSARVWDFVAPCLVAHHRVLGLDMRGHGESDHDPEFRYHHINLGRDIASVLDSLSLEGTTLVAHSTAGHAAIGFAARYPDRVRALVLLDSGAELPRSGSGGASPDTILDFASPAAFETLLGKLHPNADRTVLQHLAELWLVERPDGRWERKLDPAFYRPRTASDPENRRSFDRNAWAEKEEASLRHDLAKINCPSLIVRGEKSRRFSRTTWLEMTDEIMRDARGCEIPDAGHNIMLDQPAALSQAIGAFLETLPARAG